MKIPSCKNFEAKEGMGVYSRWAYFREGTVHVGIGRPCMGTLPAVAALGVGVELETLSDAFAGVLCRGKSDSTPP